MATVDRLDIQISASAQNASKALDKLAGKLNILSNALKLDTTSLEKLEKINGNNFKVLGEGVKQLATGMKDLQGIKKSDFNRLASGIERLASIQAGNMQAVANALIPLANGIRILSGTNFDNKSLQNLINSLTRLSNANVSGLQNVNFTALGESIKKLATALSGADKVEQNTISMTNAIAKLVGAGDNISTVTSELPRMAIALKSFMDTMSQAPILASETIAFTQSLGMLANAGGRVETVANSLSRLGTELSRFMQTMASAPNVSAGVIQMTQALAQLANSGSGAGRAANSLGQSFSRANSETFRLNSSVNVLSQSVKKLGASMTKSLKGVKSFTRQILSAFGIMGGVYGTIRGAMKSMDIASSLTEVQNVVDTTFGDMSYKVQEFADNSIKQFGMSELSVKKYASRFQAMGTAMGINSSLIESSNKYLNEQTEGYIGLSDSLSDVSLNLTKLTADIASFYDVSQKEVAEDLAAIYTGMTVPLRKYGLDLTQATLKEWAMKNGLDANIKSMSQAEKTMLRYQYVLANTTAAQGDFAKTANTWANQVRILKQNFEQLGSIIGGALINTFKPLIETLNNVLQYVIAFAEKVTEALGTIFGWKYESGGTGGIVQDWSDIADTTGEAADNIDKMKKGLRAFDELNNITSPDKSGGGAGAGGGAGEGAGGGLVKTDAIWEKYKSDIDTLYKLGKYIGDVLSKAMESIDWDSVYQKARNFGRGLAEFLNGLISPRLFEDIGKTIAGALNTALHFLDSFGLWFDWKNFGDSLAAGLLGFLNNIQWDVALSAAANWGKGIADTLNRFITPETFSATGNAIAMALNTAIQFALSFGQTFDFKNLGESIAAGINNFFATFNFSGLAEAINIWAKGILDAIIVAIDKTDWGLIGEKIGRFIADIDLIAIGKKLGKALWKAINAGIKLWAKTFSKAPIETALISILAIPKALKALTASKFIQGLGNLVGQFKNFAQASGLVVTSLAGNVTSLSRLTTQFPRLGSAISVAAQALAEFKSGLSSQGLLAGFNQGILTIRNSLSGVQKGVITAVAAFAEFNVISDVFEGLAIGSENLLAGIGKIGAAAGIAGAAMYTAFGPAGVAIAAITGVVAAVEGISDAFDEIRAEEIGNTIRDAMSAPGGVPISEITSNFLEKLTEAANGFDTIMEKSSEMDSVQKNIKNTWLEIGKIQEAMDNGVISVGKGKQELEKLFGELAIFTEQKFSSMNTAILSAYGEGGSLSTALKTIGADTETAIDTMITYGYQNSERAKEIAKELSGMTPGTEKYNTLIAELQSLTGEMDSFAKATSDFTYDMNSLQGKINYSEIFLEDGSIDTNALQSYLSEATTALSNYETSLDEAGKELTQYWQEIYDSPTATAEQKAVALQEIKHNIPDAIASMKSDARSEVLQFTNMLQSDYVGRTSQIIEDSISEWEQKGLGEQALRAVFGKSATEGEYVKEAVDRQKANIDAISDAVEAALKQFGINGAGWSKQYTDEAFAPLFSTEQSNYGANIPVFTEKLNEDYHAILESAAQNAYEYAKPIGSNTMLGSSDGINETKEEAIKSAFNALIEIAEAAKEASDEHSPSKVFAEIGSNLMKGLENGIDELKSNPISQMGYLVSDLISQFNSSENDFWNIGRNVMQGLYSGISSMASSIFSKVQEIAGGITNSIKNVLGIHSPSKVFYSLGSYTMEGFKEGLENLYKPIQDSLKGFSGNLQAAPALNGMTYQPAPMPTADNIYSDYRQAAKFMPDQNGGGMNGGYGLSEERMYNIVYNAVSTAIANSQLLGQQNETLERIAAKEFEISKSDIGHAARDYSVEYKQRTGKPAYAI